MIINDGEWWWLVGGIPTPLKNMSERQLGWNSQYDGKVIKLEKYESQLGLWDSQYMDGKIKAMFQTTNQLLYDLHGAQRLWILRRSVWHGTLKCCRGSIRTYWTGILKWPGGSIHFVIFGYGSRVWIISLWPVRPGKPPVMVMVRAVVWR